MNNDVIYFCFNNWFAGRDFPGEEPYLSWMYGRNKEGKYSDILVGSFNNEQWVKEQGLVVVITPVDMSLEYTISAPREWVEKNCPNLLTTYKNFICQPEKDGELPNGFHNTRFEEYCEENIGIIWKEREDEDDDD